MKYILSSLILFTFLFASAQVDTLVVSGESYAGSIKRNYIDRVYFHSGGIDYMVMKDRIDRMNIRNKVIINGVVGYEYISQKSALNIGNLPEFKDTKYWLRSAGVQGILGTSLLILGGSLAGIGISSKAPNAKQLVTVGSVLASTGLVLYLPTSVFILKAGRVKSYRML